MRRRPSCVLFLLLALAAGARPGRATEPLLLGGDERLLVLAPHPDDETLAAGGLIQEALALDVPVRVCFFTMGDNDETAALFTRRHPNPTPGATRALGTLRQNEALAAAGQLGLGSNDVVFLGYPDTGTLAIWNRHWRTVPPYRSPLTRAHAVPHNRALTPGSAHAGEDILDDLEEVLRAFRPTHVVVSHPADHNVDHRALYLFTRVALWDLEADGLRPELLPAPVHFTQWPEPRQRQPLRPAAPPFFLDAETAWREYSLAPFQVSNKLAALRRHHSQYQAAAPCLDAFIRKTELFGGFPSILLPGGTGAADIAEEDDSQFRPDDNLFRELTREPGRWDAIAEQNAAETEKLAGHDNEFLLRTVSGDGIFLTLAFQFQNPLKAPATLAVAVFGYRADTPFGEMPKLAFEVTPGKIVSAKDLDQPLPPDAIELESAGDDEIVLNIPYDLLGGPDRILFAARLLKGSLPVDWVPWRILDLSGEPAAQTTAPAKAKAKPKPTLAPPPAEEDKPEARPPPKKKLAKPKPAAPARKKPPEPEPEPEPPEEPAEPAAAEPAPELRKPAPLVPRVTLPRKSVPEKSEANEPVLW